MSNELLVGQKNLVFDVIKQAGLNPHDFKWSDVKGSLGDERVSRLTYVPQPEFYFMFDQVLHIHLAKFSPGGTHRRREVQTETWAQQLVAVQVWADSLRHELQQVDLWEALKQIPALAKVPPTDGDDAPISGEDRAKFIAALAEIKRLAVGQTKDPKQVEAINAIVDRTEALSWKVPKNVLWHAFVGNVMAMVMSGALTVQNAKWMLGEVQGAVTWLVLAAHSAMLSLHH